ncbi:MAG: helix-turn-helix transcriptional regulator [Armatimonadetes bacterium]|nr:helix-turn-helix transcriptional regulator [Armatimonadota bacterium]
MTAVKPEVQCDERGIHCPVAATMNILNQKWTLHIIRELLNGKRRFNELSHCLGGVNSRTLRDRLKVLEHEEIVSRQVLSTIPPWVEYELTEKGRALNGVIESIAEWGRQWMPASRPCWEDPPEGLPGGATDNPQSVMRNP